MLLLRGRPLPPHDLRVLAAFATHLAVVLDRAELAAQAAAAERLDAGQPDADRAAGRRLARPAHPAGRHQGGGHHAAHPRRPPGPPRTRTSCSAPIEDSADRLGAIIANLLDMSRLQTGGVTLVPRDVGLDDVVVRALAGLADADRVRLVLPDDLPAVRVDAGLLERVVANLVDNALRHTRSPVDVRAAAARAGCGCTSWTTARVSPTPRSRRCSSPSSGSATPRPARASASGSRWRAA